MSKYRALSYELWESINRSIGLRIPEQIELSNEDKENVYNLKWTDLDWSEIGNDGSSIIWLEMKLPIELDITKGVIVDIQLIQETFYQLHIDLAEDLRGIGLGTKIYRSIVDWAGHVYSEKGRRHNPIINQVWDNLKSEQGVTCNSNELSDICVSNRNPELDNILRLFNEG